MDGFCRKGGNQHGHRVLESGGTLGAFLFFSQDRNVKCGGLCMKREMHAEKTYWKNH